MGQRANPTDLELAALISSKICHDVIGPVGAIYNGLEILDEDDDQEAKNYALDVIRNVTEQASARLQFCRFAFGAAGSAGAELDLGEIGRLTGELVKGGKVQLVWNAQRQYWPKDWAKLLMNATLLAADCLPRGGVVTVETGPETAARSFHIRAQGTNARVTEEVAQALNGDTQNVDARHVQPFLTHKLSRSANTALAVTPMDGAVELKAG